MMTKQYQENHLKVTVTTVVGNPKDERKVDMGICGEKVEQTKSIIILGVNHDLRITLEITGKQDGRNTEN